MNEVREFRPVGIANWGRFDMSVISLIRAIEDKTGNPISDLTLWDHYWRSVGTPISYEIPSGTALGKREVIHAPPLIWEYLIDGQLEL